MAEYVNRFDVLTRVDRAINQINCGCKSPKDAVLMLWDEIEDPLRIPTADVEEVHRAAWSVVAKGSVDTVGYCSRCGKKAVWRTKQGPYKLCPNCGAKMDGEADDECVEALRDWLKQEDE